MLNGVDPIIIFNLKKNLPTSLQTQISKIPVVADIVNQIDLPLIPIYLSERLTGIYIESESKSLEVDSTIDTLSNGSQPQVSQRAISSTVRIEMVASRNSLGVGLFSALVDMLFPLVTSKEYTITYLHGAVTVFGGLIHSFAINQEATNDLYKITLELVRPGKPRSFIPTVIPIPGTETLSGVAVPAA